MPERTSKLVCPQCQIEMNQHAEKLLDPVNAEQAAQADPALGGVIQEFHACPGCGACASRMAQA
jgi:hypothetical protein